MTEKINGPTPSGNKYAIIYYQDSNGEPANKDEATRVEIVEFDDSDTAVFRTYAVLKKDS